MLEKYFEALMTQERAIKYLRSKSTFVENTTLKKKLIDYMCLGIASGDRDPSRKLVKELSFDIFNFYTFKCMSKHVFRPNHKLNPSLVEIFGAVLLTGAEPINKRMLGANNIEILFYYQPNYTSYFSYLSLTILVSEDIIKSVELKIEYPRQLISWGKGKKLLKTIEKNYYDAINVNNRLTLKDPE